MIEHQLRQRRFARGGRLQKRAGRQRHQSAADFHKRLRRLRHQLAVAGDACELEFCGDTGERRRSIGAERPGTAHVHVQAGIGRGHLDVERFVRRLQDLGDHPGRRDSAVEPRRQDRTAVDGDDVMRAWRGEADLQHVFCAAPCMQHRAPAALTVRVDDVGHRRDDAGLGKRFGHQPAFPEVIFGERPVLHGAAAALGEMLADRRYALVARPVDMVEMAAVGMAGDRFDRHDFARQRVWHIDRPCGVSAMPSPRWPRRAMVSCSVTRGTQQELGIAVAAFDRRGDDADNAPAERGDETRNVVANRRAHGDVSHDAFLERRAAGLELRFDQRDQLRRTVSPARGRAAGPI